jgi:hypothetical protein
MPPVGLDPRRSSSRRLVRGVTAAPTVRAWATAVGIAVLLVLLTWPLVTHGSRLRGDAINDAWFIAHQADALRQSYLPSHYIHSGAGLFNGVFTFYGGTLLTFAGAISLIVGSAMAAQAIVYILAMAAAYGGWFWLARMAGLRFWPAHAPALLFVTAPYVVSNVNGRQDLAESVATAVIPLLLASAISVLRADRLRAGPFAALAISTIFIGGSHNLTLLWAITILGLAAMILLAGVPQARRLVTRRGLLRVLAVMAPAMAINAWYLLPDLAYHADTIIAQRIDEWRALVRTPSPAIDAKHLFSLGRPSTAASWGLVATLPVLAIAWVVIAAVAVRKRWRDAWARTLMILSLLSVGVTIVMTHPRLISALPDPWQMIQFSYRLETFVLFGICGAVIAALVLLGPDGHRWLTALLLPILALSVLGALRQIDDVPRRPSNFAWTIDSLAPFSTGDFADASMRPLPQDAGLQKLTFTRSDVHRDRLETTIRAQPGEIVHLNLMAISQMIDVQGARVVGRWAGKPYGTGWQVPWFLALQIDDDATPGKARVVIREAHTLPIVGGRIISILGLLGLAANGAMIPRSHRRRRESQSL